MSSQRPVSPQVRNSQNYVWNRLDVLGHGATCEVFKAYHKTTGEPAAVKVFNKAGISRDMYQQQVCFPILYASILFCASLAVYSVIGVFLLYDSVGW